VAQLANPAAPEVSAAAGFHRNHASRQLAAKLQDLCPPQLLAQNRLAGVVGSLHLEYILRKIEPDCGDL
jgi:hypothetical protein